MKRAGSSKRARVITVFAVALAASAIIPATGAQAARGCGCAAAARCPQASARGRVDASESSPSTGGRAELEDHSDPGGASWPRASSMLGADGAVIKISFYRGIGGGLTGSYSRDGIGLTFETGVGVGGSFSAGSITGRPDSGLSLEGRASTSGRIGPAKPPDFGITLAQDGRLQAYMDAKTGNYRTRFRSKPIQLDGDAGEQETETLQTRRSWSLGTEFKLAAADTVWLSWGGILGEWKGLLGALLGGRDSQAPPAGSADAQVCAPAAAGRLPTRLPFPLRRHETEYRATIADRFSEPRVFRAHPATRGAMSSRLDRSHRTHGPSPTKPSRHGAGKRGDDDGDVHAAWISSSRSQNSKSNSPNWREIA
ncbi:MAG: hypothetical protein ACRDNL_13180 [Spirillospora sp.]